MRVCRALVFGLCLWPGVVAAQTPARPDGPEVIATVLHSNLWDDESGLGAGIAAGGGAGYRWRNLGFEARVEWFANNRTFPSGVKFSADGRRVLGQIAYYFSSAKVQPFASGAIGVLSVKQRNEYPVVQPGPTGLPIVIGTEIFESEHTNTLWGGGGGVRIRLGDRLSLRPEGTVLLSVPDNFWDIRGGVSAIVSW
jgi:hypothetical protein